MLRYFLPLFLLITSAHAEEQAQVVTVTAVKEGVLNQEIKGVGTFTPYSDVILKAETSGTVDTVTFNDGDRVKEKQLLISLNNKEQKAEVMKAEAALELSQNTFKRKKSLTEKKFISSQNIETAEAELKSYQADLDLAKEKLAKTTVYSPFDGVLSNRKVAKGSFVAEGDELVRIQDITPMRLTFNVPQKDIPFIKVGDTVAATTDVYPNQAFEGTVEAVEPSVNEETRSVKIFATFANKDELLIPGLYGHASIISTANQNKVLLIPEQALVVRPTSVNVFKKVGDIAVLTPITLGRRATDLAEVLTGLNKGDVIVLEGQNKIHDGSLIKVK